MKIEVELIQRKGEPKFKAKAIYDALAAVLRAFVHSDAIDRMSIKITEE